MTGSVYIPRSNLPFEQRRGEVGNIRAQQIAPTRVAGFDKVEGAGEVAFDVDFKLWFVERPAMSFGGELDDTQPLTAEHYPTVSVVVFRWVKKQTNRLGGGYYTGATLAVVTTGPDDMKLIVHWQAEGKAMQNPVAPSTLLDGTL